MYFVKDPDKIWYQDPAFRKASIKLLDIKFCGVPIQYDKCRKNLKQDLVLSIR